MSYKQDPASRMRTKTGILAKPSWTPKASSLEPKMKQAHLNSKLLDESTKALRNQSSWFPKNVSAFSKSFSSSSSLREEDVESSPALKEEFEHLSSPPRRSFKFPKKRFSFYERPVSPPSEKSDSSPKEDFYQNLNSSDKISIVPSKKLDFKQAKVISPLTRTQSLSPNEKCGAVIKAQKRSLSSTKKCLPHHERPVSPLSGSLSSLLSDKDTPSFSFQGSKRSSKKRFSWYMRSVSPPSGTSTPESLNWDQSKSQPSNSISLSEITAQPFLSNINNSTGGTGLNLISPKDNAQFKKNDQNSSSLYFAATITNLPASSKLKPPFSPPKVFLPKSSRNDNSESNLPNKTLDTCYIPITTRLETKPTISSTIETHDSSTIVEKNNAVFKVNSKHEDKNSKKRFFATFVYNSLPRNVQKVVDYSKFFRKRNKRIKAREESNKVRRLKEVLIPATSRTILKIPPINVLPDHTSIGEPDDTSIEQAEKHIEVISSSAQSEKKDVKVAIEFEVEMVLAKNRYNNRVFYLVKWRGFPDTTWEPLTNMKSCKELINAFNSSALSISKDSSPELVNELISWLPNTNRVSNTSLLFKNFTYLPKNLQGFMELFSADIGPVLSVVNQIDKQGPPTKFTYINNNFFSEGAYNKNHHNGFECKCIQNCYSARSSSCGCMALNVLGPPYNNDGLLILPPRSVIYECGPKCCCPSTCPNRVVQRGRKVGLQVFRTEKKGWGLRALKPIPKGTFIVEFVGEVITDEEAEKRGKEVERIGLNYLFELDGVIDPPQYVVDGMYYGNLSHYFNHSCDPNIRTHPVFIDNHYPGLHRIAFFAHKDIFELEELSIDYSGDYDSNPTKKSTYKRFSGKKKQKKLKPGQAECFCGSIKCTGYFNN